jgi:hypothetical protein
MTREAERKLSQQINALFMAVRIILEGLPNKGGRLVDEAELERERGNPIARGALTQPCRVRHRWGLHF